MGQQQMTDGDNDTWQAGTKNDERGQWMVCWAGTYSAQQKVTQMLDLLLVGFEVTTKVEVGRKEN